MKTSYYLCYVFIATVPTISAFVNPIGKALLHHHQTANNDNNDKDKGAPMQQYSFMNKIFLSTTIGMWFVGSLVTSDVANAAEAEYSNTLDVFTGTSSLLVTTNEDSGMTVSNYLRQVFQSPLVGNTPGMPTKPIPTDKYATREERNRAYDEAFQQDARDRDAYYGQMAIRKRQGVNQNVEQYRESLGLDGTGDVRMRVGEERVQGLSSLKELKTNYLSSQQDSSQTTDETPDK